MLPLLLTTKAVKLSILLPGLFSLISNKRAAELRMVMLSVLLLLLQCMIMMMVKWHYLHPPHWWGMAFLNRHFGHATLLLLFFGRLGWLYQTFFKICAVMPSPMSFCLTFCSVGEVKRKINIIKYCTSYPWNLFLLVYLAVLLKNSKDIKHSDIRRRRLNRYFILALYERGLRVEYI